MWEFNEAVIQFLLYVELFSSKHQWIKQDDVESKQKNLNVYDYAWIWWLI